MASGSRSRDRGRLEQDLQTDEYQNLLRDLQRREPFIRQFETWADVLAFMRTGTSRDPRKDEILRPIFQAHSDDQDPHWRSILLGIFWPALESIHVRKRHWDPESAERWRNITWSFLRVLCRIDIKRRPERLAQKIYNDTVHYLYEECRRAWDHADREITKGRKETEAWADIADGVDLAGIERRNTQGIEVNRLREHLHAGRITEADCLLLVGTRIYGKSIADYAREAGLNYQLVKKRRQRAEAAIRRSEGEMQ